VDAKRVAAGGEVHDLAEGRVGEVCGGESVLRFRDLLRGAPGGDPDWLGLCAGLWGERGDGEREAEGRVDSECGFHGRGFRIAEQL
jgi:hypothetical protein